MESVPKIDPTMAGIKYGVFDFPCPLAFSFAELLVEEPPMSGRERLLSVMVAATMDPPGRVVLPDTVTLVKRTAPLVLPPVRVSPEDDPLATEPDDGLGFAPPFVCVEPALLLELPPELLLLLLLLFVPPLFELPLLLLLLVLLGLDAGGLADC